MKNKCLVCGKENLSKDEIGINKKLINKNVSQLYCMDCLAIFLDVSVADLEDKIEQFKEEGCTLF